VVPAAAPVSPPQPAPQRTALELTDEGFEHARNDDWAAAITLYRQAIEADPSYARAYSNLGYALNRLGLYGDAIGVLSEGIEKTPNSVLLHRLYDSRGFARSNLKDYDGAIQDFTRALEYTQTNPRVYHHRAESKALAGRYSEAYSDTLLALRFDPFYSPALRLRGKLESQGYVKPLGIRNATAPA
jgi:tetratricopeptide (TPR) repeat protein